MRSGHAALIVAALAWSAAGAPRPAAGADLARATEADTAHAAPVHPALPSGHPDMAPAPGANPHGTSPHGASPHGMGGGGAPAKPFKIVVPPGTPKVRTVTLGIRHRVYHDFAESDEARLRETFTIGDTPYSAIVTDFLPDFVIDVSARRITSRSNEPRNPAVRIIVRENGVARDTSWAFLNMPPHFSARSLLAFQLLRIDFADRPPLLADTSAIAHPRPDSAAARAHAPDTSSAKSKP
jgi:hypothetical protein